MRRVLTLVLVAVLTAACGGEAAVTTTGAPSTTGAENVTTGADATAQTTSPPPDTTGAAPEPDGGATLSTEPAAPATTDQDGATGTTAEPATTSAAPTTTTTTVPEPVLTPSPLTGLGVENPDLLARRTMAVKVDNHWDSRPQSGIAEAEVVFELLVESGITRFIALFHAVDAAGVGPVRSVRPTDPHLLRHFNATLLASGGQDWIQGLFPRNGVGLIGEIGVGGYRDPERSAPHNYFVNTAELRPVADERLYPNTAPPPLFWFGDLPAAAILGSVYQVEVGWAPDNIVTWRWSGDRWERHLPEGPHFWTSAEGATGVIAADTLVVLFAPLFYTQPPSGSGYALPTMETTGEGRALVFSGTQVAEGRWTRVETTQPFILTLADGAPLTVPPGRAWINLFPEGRPVTW